MYHPDLSPHIYVDPGENVLNVGWLDSHHEYSKGSVPLDFLERLQWYCQESVFLTFGFHVCEFCGKDFGVEMLILGKKRKLGSAEIRVIGQKAIYAAPDMIYHYIVDHQYRPPDEFILAVIEEPLALDNPMFGRLFGDF